MRGDGLSGGEEGVRRNRRSDRGDVGNGLLEVEGIDGSVGIAGVGIRDCFQEWGAESAGAMPVIDVRGNVGEDDFGVGGSTAGICGNLGVLEDSVDWVEGTLKEGGEAARASERGGVESV